MEIDFMKLPGSIVNDFIYQPVDSILLKCIGDALKQHIPGEYQFVGINKDRNDRFSRLVVKSDDPLTILRLSGLV